MFAPGKMEKNDFSTSGMPLRDANEIKPTATRARINRFAFDKNVFQRPPLDKEFGFDDESHSKIHENE